MDEIELNKRIKAAIILLNDGHPLRVGELFFANGNKASFSVSGVTHINRIENITQESAKEELSDIKSLFSNMTSHSKELADYIKEKHIEYHLYYDYGMGSIEICSEKDGHIKWKTELTER